MAEFSMDRVVEILRERDGVDAYVEHTGGGVATIYAGPTWAQPDGDYTNERNAVVAGPGSFGGFRGEPNTADDTEFYIGMDDDGVTSAVDLTEHVSEGQDDPEVLASTAARLIATQVRVNTVLVEGLANRAKGIKPTERVPGVGDLSTAELGQIVDLTIETVRYKFCDAVASYAAFDGWNTTPRAERGTDVAPDNPHEVEVRVLDGKGGVAFTGMLADAPFALPGGIYGILTPNGRSLRVRIRPGVSAEVTDDLPYVPGHPEVPMPDPDDTFVSVNHPEDHDGTHPPMWEGKLSEAHRNLVPILGTYRAFLPAQDVEVGLRVANDRAVLVTLVGGAR